MNWEKVYAVQKMQDYILMHSEEEPDPETMARAAGYSMFHALRIFKELTGLTPGEYGRSIRLTAAAKQLRDTDRKILDVALDSGFDSHDGFTRAFFRKFRIGPKNYRNEKPPVTYFVHYPVRDYFSMKERNPMMPNKEIPIVVTAQVIERPARKLILLRSKKATDYFSYCEEMGCEWEGYFNSFAERFDNAALLELPKHMVLPGTSVIASGIEVPADFQKALPEQYDVETLPPVKMLIFRSSPYEKEEDYCTAIEAVLEAIEQYRPANYGLAFSFESAPKFNYGADMQTGARAAVPVKER